MQSIHSQFIAALEAGKLIRLGFHHPSGNQIVKRFCAPLEYGSQPELGSSFSRYWVLEYDSEWSGCILGLQPKRILTLQLLDQDVYVWDPSLSHRHWEIGENRGFSYALPEYVEFR